MPKASASFEPGLREIAREERATRRRKKHDSAMSMAEWARRVPIAGVGPVDLDPEGDWGYTIEPFYSDEAANAQESVKRKSTQVGASEGEWRQAGRAVDQYGDRVIYVFPTDTHVRDFGDDKIEPAIEESDWLQRRMPRRFVKHKTLKRIGNGFLYLRGANSMASAQSIGGQMLVLDEYDELPPKMIAQYERRLSGAKQIGKMPRTHRLGVPRYPGFGIDAAYKLSDQREWHVRCRECDTVQPIRWGENVRWTMPGSDYVHKPGDDVPFEELDNPKRVGDVWRACAHCEASLEGKAIRAGEWIATNPESHIPGWWIHRLIVPNTDLAQIVVASRGTAEGDIEAFYQNDLGLPYAPADSRLDEATIRAAMAEGLGPGQLAQTYTGRRPTTMGLDTAGERTFNFRISEQLPGSRSDEPNPRRALAIGALYDDPEAPTAIWDRAAELMDRYRVDVCVVDAGPERRGAKAFRKRYPGRVVLCEYEYREEAKSFVVKDVGEKGTRLEGVPLSVRVQRTDAIDAMMDSIRTKINAPMRVVPPGYIAQMMALVRRTVFDSKGRPWRVYEKEGAADDYAHAEVYDLVATELLRMRHGVAMQVERSKPQRMADDRVGFKRVRLDAGTDDYRAGFGEEA